MCLGLLVDSRGTLQMLSFFYKSIYKTAIFNTKISSIGRPLYGPSFQKRPLEFVVNQLFRDFGGNFCLPFFCETGASVPVGGHFGWVLVSLSCGLYFLYGISHSGGISEVGGVVCIVII